MKSKTWFAIITIFLILGIVVQTQATLQVWAESRITEDYATAWAIPVDDDGDANDVPIGFYTGAGWADARAGGVRIYVLDTIWINVYDFEGNHYYTNYGVVATAYGSGNKSASSSGSI